jgi:hypothetical protein
MLLLYARSEVYTVTKCTAMRNFPIVLDTEWEPQPPGTHSPSRPLMELLYLFLHFLLGTETVTGKLVL